jgi:hypothetical protein
MKTSFAASFAERLPGLAAVSAVSVVLACGSDAARAAGDGSAASPGSAGVDASTGVDAAQTGADTDGSVTPDDGSAAATADASDEAAPGCPGVAIVPDDGGLVATGSNSVGIHGSWFVYSDCADLKGLNCATVTTPPTSDFPNSGGKMCTSGHTSMAAGAWGAGIALELNDGPPQLPYDTVASGIKGFCFQLSGPTIPATTVRVAFPTQDNNDNAYFEAVNTPGQHTVLFADTAQGSWVTTPASFEPTKVTLIQFQIPSSTTASVPWDFCIEGLTAIMQ